MEKTTTNSPIPDKSAGAPEHAESPEKHNKVGFNKLVIAGIIAAIVLVGGYFIYNSTQKKSSSQQQVGTVKIGVMQPFSGDASFVGFGALKGIQLAKKDLAADNIELIQADTKCDEEGAKKAFNDLVAQKVVAILGGGCSLESVAVLPEANRLKILMLSPASSSPELSMPDDYFFRDIAPDSIQGIFTASLLYDKGVKKIGVLYPDDTYGINLAKALKDKFKELGGNVVADLQVAENTTTLDKEIAQIKTTNPDAIYIVPNSFLTGAPAIRLIRQAGIKTPLYGSEGFYDEAIVKDAGVAASEGFILTTFSTGTKAFKQQLEAEYGVSEATYAAPQGYDAFKALYLVIQQGATTGEKIKEALPKLEFEGVSGYIKFDKNGEVTENYKYSVVQVKNGKFVLLEE